jgi:hypothetical protein
MVGEEEEAHPTEEQLSTALEELSKIGAPAYIEKIAKEHAALEEQLRLDVKVLTAGS